MKKILLSTLLTMYALVCAAQIDSIIAPKWKHDMQTGINLNQASYSDNWKGGGVSSYALGWFFNHLAKYKTTQLDLNSDLQLQLGYLQIKGEVQRKNSDRIFYDFKLGYRLAEKWSAFGSVNFLSQFKPGYDFKTKSIVDANKDSLISNFLAPAYLTSSVGIEYKPLSYLWMRFGAGTLRQTLVLDKEISNAGLYGLKNPGDKIRNQLVFQYIINFDKDITPTVNFKWRYMVNFDYLNPGQPNTFVHIINANLILKATKYINTQVTINLIRDYDMDKDIQLAQTLSLGIMYSLNR